MTRERSPTFSLSRTVRVANNEPAVGLIRLAHSGLEKLVASDQFGDGFMQECPPCTARVQLEYQRALPGFEGFFVRRIVAARDLWVTLGDLGDVG